MPVTCPPWNNQHTWLAWSENFCVGKRVHATYMWRSLLALLVLPAECIEQCPGLLQIRRVKALGEPAVDRRQQRPRFGLLALLLPEATEAHGGP